MFGEQRRSFAQIASLHLNDLSLFMLLSTQTHTTQTATKHPHARNTHTHTHTHIRQATLDTATASTAQPRSPSPSSPHHHQLQSRPWQITWDCDVLKISEAKSSRALAKSITCNFSTIRVSRQLAHGTRGQRTRSKGASTTHKALTNTTQI